MTSTVAASEPTTPVATRRGELTGGVRAIFPLVVGGIPFGIIYGAVAVTSGLSPWAAMGMSLFVFAGSAQFIAVGLVSSATPLPVIWLTTFVVNVRHALYSASLAPYVRKLPQHWVLPLAFLLTDEAYLIAINRYEQPDASPYKHYFYLGSALVMYASWQLCTLIGVLFGAAVPDPTRWGLDFAMSATFIGMIVPAIKTRPALLAVIVASVVAVTAQGLPNQLWLILATLCGVAAGVLSERRWPNEPPPSLEAEARNEAILSIEETS